MNDKPNVTVIYQDAPQQPVGCTAVLVEVIVVIVFIGGEVLIYRIF